FEPFYQAENHTNGTGLGLSLCKEIASLHHGSITVRSELGKGTEFTVRLPMGDAHLTEEDKAQSPAPHASGEANETASHLSVLEHEHESDAHGNGTATEISNPDVVKDHSILVVEDHPEMRRFLSEKLAAHFTVFTAADAREGINQAQAQLPDLIISDVLMPGLLGTEFAKKLKADVRTATIPIILLTARGSDEQMLTGLGTLADAYLTKPFNFAHLIAVANNLIHNRKLLH